MIQFLEFLYQFSFKKIPKGEDIYKQRKLTAKYLSRFKRTMKDKVRFFILCVELLEA